MSILYRELQYKIIKNNPKITDEKKFEKKLKKSTNVKRKIATQSLIFSFLGFSLASSVFFAQDKSVISSILVTLAVVPFVFSIYQTTVQTSYIDSLDIFEPLKSLPLRIGSFQLTAVLSIDFIPMLGIALPTIGYLLIYYPISSILALAWFLTGILIGHTLGLLIYNAFGFRVEEGGKKLRFVKNFFKILGFLAFMSMFFIITYLQDYIVAQSQIILRYSIAYPFSIASVFDPFKSVLFLFIHLVVAIPLYLYSSKKVWNNIIGTKSVTKRVKSTDYSFSIENPLSALVKKDLKIVFRKSAMVAGFLVPLYVVIPQIFIAIRSGDLAIEQTTLYLFMVGVLTITTTDAILKVDGKAIDTLRKLPLTKWRFVLSKAFSMSVITIIMSFALISLGTYFHLEALILIPYAFLLPLIASFFSMFYLFRYKSETIGTPDFNIYKLFPLLILTGLIFALIGLPILILDGHLRFLASQAIAAGILSILYKRLRG